MSLQENLKAGTDRTHSIESNTDRTDPSQGAWTWDAGEINDLRVNGGAVGARLTARGLRNRVGIGDNSSSAGQ
jgi:hypothetical protein